jgi:hypothetical protein
VVVTEGAVTVVLAADDLNPFGYLLASRSRWGRDSLEFQLILVIEPLDGFAFGLEGVTNVDPVDLAEFGADIPGSGLS